MNSVVIHSERQTYISLYTGGGGLDLAFRRENPAARCILYVERDMEASALLADHIEAGLMDAAPIWSDSSTLDCRPFAGKVDWVIGGFPCQPWSFAGKRSTTDDSRWLWPHIERIIREVRPRGLFLENVPGLVRGDSNLYLKAWPKAGSMRSGVVSKQAMLEPVTEEKGSSSWPTVTTDSVSQRTKKYKQGGHPLSMVASEWPTPTTQEYPHPGMVINEKGRREPKKGKTDHSLNLEDRSSLWLTPSANEDAAGTLAGNMQNMISHQVQAQAQSGEIFSPDDPTSHQRRLNTKMVTWLMGWPEGWLDMHSFVSSETE